MLDNDVLQKAGAVRQRTDAEVGGKRLAEVGEGAPRARGRHRAGTRAPVIRSGTYSREWSVLGVVGSLPWSAVTTSRSVSRSAVSTVAEPLVEALEVGGVARHVVAMTVQRVEVDEVREDQSRLRRPIAWRPARGPGLRRRSPSDERPGDAPPGEQVVDLADRRDGDAAASSDDRAACRPAASSA